ncbi:MAG: DUF4011 domain-containing protein [Myxococcales bacterium]|nr:DUF4011 domain-containing protein [Myxococcales bacterium]
MSELAPASPPRDASLPQAAIARLEVWQRSLLDLSLRNRMLDMRASKQILPFVGADPVAVAAAVGAEQALTVVAAPGVAALAAGASPHALCAALSDDEIDARLIHMARLARTQRDDGGVEVLWLAVGTLVWRERDDATSRRAPVLLVPVALTRRHARERYAVVARADEARLNLTLLEKLRAEWGLTPELPAVKEDGEHDVEAVFAAMRAALPSEPGWQLVPEVTLGVFSFAKFVMWTDLAQRAAAIAEAPVAGRLLSPGHAGGHAGPVFMEPADLDAAPVATTYTPLDADSTQLAAVMAASAGATFVLQGPPGTGKSQTITNLIAHAMAQGKRVLFVSEKMAALEVVQRRLTQAGLGDFCLELHSNKAQKRDVIADLGRVLERAWRPVGAAAGDDDSLARLREELNAYVVAIGTPLPLGFSFQRAVAEIEALAAVAVVPSGITVDPAHVASAEAFAAAQAHVSQFSQALEMVSPVATHPWRDSSLATWLPTRGERWRRPCRP